MNLRAIKAALETVLHYARIGASANEASRKECDDAITILRGIMGMLPV